MYINLTLVNTFFFRKDVIDVKYSKYSAPKESKGHNQAIYQISQGVFPTYKVKFFYSFSAIRLNFGL